VILELELVFSMTPENKFWGGRQNFGQGEARLRNHLGEHYTHSNFQTHSFNSRFNIMILQTLWRYHMHSVSEKPDQVV
jgi:hypothetical protein